MESKSKNLELAAQIVAAYVGNNPVPQADIPRLISDIYKSLEGIASGEAPKAQAVELKPAINARKSITPDFLVCLEDGKKFKSLKRHLRSHYNLSPEQYREKWGLAADYPMVAPQLRDGALKPGQAHGIGQAQRPLSQAKISSPPTLADQSFTIHKDSCKSGHRFADRLRGGCGWGYCEHCFQGATYCV